MIPEHEVIERLRELAEATKRYQAAPQLETTLLRAFSTTHGAQPTPVNARVRWVPAVAASVALAVTVAALVLQTRALPPRGGRVPDPTSVPSTGLLDGFVAVPGADSLPRLESASIVRYELPMTALPAYGVQIVPDAARRAIRADLLIGQDGYPRAIRLVVRSEP